MYRVTTAVELLTIIIPTKNRREFLQRLLIYYAKRGVNFPIIVADSSDSDNRISAAFIDKMNSELNIKYRIFDERVSFYEKLTDSIKNVESKYIVVCADDDFLIPSALESAVNFLTTHPDYGVVHGDSAVFSLKNNSPYGKIDSFTEYEQRSVESNNPIERLLDHFNHYSTTVYSVHRTDLLKKNFNKIKKLDIDLSFSELLLSGIDITQGKAKKLNVLYMIRQTSLKKNYPITPTYQRIGNISWSKDLSTFKKILADEIIEQTGLGLESVNNEINKAFFLYLNLLIPKKMNEIIISPPHKTYSGFIINYLRKTKRLKHFLSFLGYLINRNKYKMFLGAIMSPVHPYHNSFLPVYKAITSQRRRNPDPRRKYKPN